MVRLHTTAVRRNSILARGTSDLGLRSIVQVHKESGHRPAICTWTRIWRRPEELVDQDVRDRYYLPKIGRAHV